MGDHGAAKNSEGGCPETGQQVYGPRHRVVYCDEVYQKARTISTSGARDHGYGYGATLIFPTLGDDLLGRDKEGADGLLSKAVAIPYRRRDNAPTHDQQRDHRRCATLLPRSSASGILI